MSKTIYILMIIGWVIYNFYKAGKKAMDAKKTVRPQNTPHKEIPKQNETRTLLEELLSERTEKKTVPSEMPTRPAYTSMEEIIDEAQYDTETRYNNETEIMSPELVTKTNYFESRYNESSEIHSVHNEAILAEEQTEEQTNFIEDMDITKAVIYSEILKRPAYI